MGNTLLIEDHVEKIDGLQTSYDAFKYLRLLSEEAGYNTFSVMSLGEGANDISDMSVVNNWNPELIQIYDGEELAVKSPILEHGKTSVRPLSYSLEHLPQNRSDLKKSLSIELFNDFNMQHGLSLPVQNVRGEKGVISFAGDRVAQNESNKFGVHVLAGYLFEIMTVAKEEQIAHLPQLTERERDCLSWTAAGKTSSEIALILELSDHTINHYLTFAARKLDAVNRVQAVAKAIRLQLLR
jgi:DNA-binding CsgD family transcriptional regulator